MITGIGIDIIEVERIQKLIETKPRFLQRIYTPEEIGYCKTKMNRHQHFAARFAAKEAFFKAIGRRISWKNVELVNLPSGKPQLKLKSEEKFDFERVHVSISHLEEYATAIVILEKFKESG
jgi:holo-[acyl-carrier protein] synthase